MDEPTKTLLTELYPELRKFGLFENEKQSTAVGGNYELFWIYFIDE